MRRFVAALVLAAFAALGAIDAVKYSAWDNAKNAKNAKLRKERGVGFEDIVFHIERGGLLDILAFDLKLAPGKAPGRKP